MDKTKHNPEVKHTPSIVGEILKHSKAWYEFWGDKCPVCQAEAESTL